MGRQEYLFGPDKRPGFRGSVIDFIGHVIGTTMIFLVIVLLGWLVSMRFIACMRSIISPPNC